MFDWLERLLFGKEAVLRKRRLLQLQATAERIGWGVANAQARERAGVSQKLTADDLSHNDDVRYSRSGYDPYGGIRCSIRPIAPAHRGVEKKIDFSSVEKERTFAQRLNELVKRHCEGVPSRCYGCAGVRRQTYSKIICKPCELVY